MKFKVGDKAYCKIKGNSIILSANHDFDIVLKFDIIGKDQSKYLLSVPSFYSIKNSWNIKEEHIDKFDANPNFLDTRAIAIPEDRIVKIQNGSTKEDGMFCERCKEFQPMVEPNQDSGSFICFSCRSNPWR